MDPLTLMLGLAAVVFGLTTMMYWRRAADLDERVRELEAKLTDSLPAPKDVAKSDAPAAREEPLEAPAPVQEAPGEDEDDDEDEEDEDEEDEDEEDEDEEDEEEPEAKAPAVEEEKPEEPEEQEEVAAAPEPPQPEPAKPAAVAAPAKPKDPEPDPLRLEALKIVTEAFELARYLDFDAIVEKPSTYRVTVPITAANGKAVRYMTDGMFNCLKKVKLEDNTAVLHVDTSKGPP